MSWVRAFLLVGVYTHAIAQSGAPKFEVASIKLADPAARGTSINAARARLEITNINLTGLIGYAFNIRNFQILGGPAWIRTDRFNVIATYDNPEEGSLAVRDKRVRERMRDLLATRFQLLLRNEEKEMTVLALMSEKGGNKLNPKPSGPGATNVNQNNGGGTIRGNGVTAKELAATIGGILGQAVIDESGAAAEDRFEYELKWSAETDPNGGPTFRTALREQLGLRLVSKRAPVPVVNVMRAEKPSEN